MVRIRLPVLAKTKFVGLVLGLEDCVLGLGRGLEGQTLALALRVQSLLTSLH